MAEPFLWAATGCYRADISSRMLKLPAPDMVHGAAANVLLYFILLLCWSNKEHFSSGAFFAHVAPSQSSEGWRLGSHHACSPVTRWENVPYQEFRSIFLPVQRDGMKDLLPATHPPNVSILLSHFLFPHFYINPEAPLNLQPAFSSLPPRATCEIPVSPKPHRTASQLGYAPGPLHCDVAKRDLCKNFC